MNLMSAIDFYRSQQPLDVDLFPANELYINYRFD